MKTTTSSVSAVIESHIDTDTVSLRKKNKQMQRMMSRNEKKELKKVHNLLFQLKEMQRSQEGIKRIIIPLSVLSQILRDHCPLTVNLHEN